MRTPCVTQSEHTDSERERVLYNNNNPMGRTFFLFSFHVESEASLYDGILKSVARSREKRRIVLLLVLYFTIRCCTVCRWMDGYGSNREGSCRRSRRYCGFFAMCVVAHSRSVPAITAHLLLASISMSLSLSFFLSVLCSTCGSWGEKRLKLERLPLHTFSSTVCILECVE